MKSDQLYKQWLKRLVRWERELSREWQACRQSGEVESIHRLRVILRRLRVCLRPGNNLLGREKVTAFRRWSASISDAVAGVRDVDVTLEWLQQQPANLPVLQALCALRERLWRQGRKKLVRLLPVLHEVAGKTKKCGKLPQRFRRKFEALLGEARREIMAFDSPLDTADTEHWHELRRDLRRIRYLREMALTGKARRKDALLRELVHLQELLGNAQNCVAARGLLAAKSTALSARDLIRQLESERRTWLAKAQRALKVFQCSRAWNNFPLAKI